MYTNIDTPTLRALLEQLTHDPGVTNKMLERLKWLLHFAENGRSVSATCRQFAISRITFYRLLRRFDPSDPRTLQDKSRRPHTIHSVTPLDTVTQVIESHGRFPQLSYEKLNNLLFAEHGISISVSTIARILQRVEEKVPDTQKTHISDAHAHCVLCRCRSHGPLLKRFLILSSLVVNAALIAMLAGQLFTENTQMNERINASVIAPGMTEFRTPLLRP